jgi:hypothetical protein
MYMKKLIILPFFAMAIALMISSCKKDHGATPSVKLNTLYFGEFNPAVQLPSSRFYLLENGKLYTEPMPFNEVPDPTYIALLPDSLYQIAKYLINNFPLYLMQHSTDSAIGCPGCADGVIVRLWAVTDTGTLKWDINTDTTQLPTEIRQYVWQTENIIDQL